MEEKEKKLLKKIARKSIEAGLEGKEMLLDSEEIPASLKENRGTFVTLKIDNQLRGCIGHIEAVQELYKDVAENAYSAAFRDPRFPPLSKEEYQNLNISISVLTKPERFVYQNTQELLEYLDKNKPGVILKKGTSQSTFLPQVWEDLKHPEEFLTHLSLKAGLAPDAWRDSVEIYTYTAEEI